MAIMDELRAQEFSRLDAGRHVYLDYTGGGLYAESQIRTHMELLDHAVLGNPHSENPASLASTHFVEQARARIRAFFNADPEEYEVIFTANASGALKLVGESYPFEAGSRCVLIADNHNSVNGIREFARSKGAAIHYVSLDPQLRIDESDLHAQLAGVDSSKANLFAYPAQSNFSGVQHPLEWIEMAQEMGYAVLLDAAAFVPTNRLDLRAAHPDFICLSFYKIFGYPTGVGALIARRETLAKLRRPWFAGGTVRFVSAQNDLHLLQVTGEAFEDGTVNYLSIAAVISGLDFIERVGIDAIHTHVAALTGRMLDAMQMLKHSNGAPMVQIYGPKNSDQRGGTIAFNVVDPSGTEVDSKIVEQRANAQNISLRSGCFCNPGSAEAAFRYNEVEAYQCFTDIVPEGFTLQQFSACLRGMPVGAVRLSVGLATNQADLDAAIALLKTFTDCDPMPFQNRDLPEIVGG